MKNVLTFLIGLSCVSSALAAGPAQTSAEEPSSVAYLVPFTPSQLIDAYGGRWTAALIGYNFATADVEIDCDTLTCRPLLAQEAFYASESVKPSVQPLVVRLPAQRAADVMLEQVVTGLTRTSIESSARSIRLPVRRIDQIRDLTLTFLDVDPNGFDTRANLRVYVVLPDDNPASVKVSIFREHEGRSSAIFGKTIDLATVVTNGVRIGYGVISWPPTLARTPFPMRVTVEGDHPLWGFITTTELSDQPAVSIIQPTERP